MAIKILGSIIVDNNRNIIDASSIGIGVTNTTLQLDVAGDANISNTTTLGNVQISSGIITASSGIVTYFGDGSQLFNLPSSGINQILNDGSVVGTSITSLNFRSGNLVATAVGSAATITLSDNPSFEILNVTGISSAQAFANFDYLQAPHNTTVTFAVTVASKNDSHRYYNTGSGNAYLINGVQAPFLTLTPGVTYRFNNNNTGSHPLKFYLEADKTTEYTSGVNFQNTYTEITVSDQTPTVLHYQCTAHAYMGNAIQTNSNVVNTNYPAVIRDTLNVSGVSTFKDKVHLLDNDILHFGGAEGDNGDLQIFHDGTDAHISNSTGGLYINQYLDDGDIALRTDDGSGGFTNYIVLDGSEGSVNLYHYGSKKLETTGIGVSIINGTSDTATITGPSNLIIDPAVVGNDTGLVRIKGDLFVDGTTTQINSTSLEIADFIVGIATTATTDLLTDGAGIQIGPDNTFLYEFNGGTNPSLKSSENLNVASGKGYQVDQTEVLNATTLGSGVTNSSLTSVGTLSSLTVSGNITANGNIVGDNSTNITGIDGVTATTLTGTPANTNSNSAFSVTANGSSAYRFTGPGNSGSDDNPDLYLVRGQRYTFTNNSGGSHPFQIRESSGGSAYNDGVTNNGASSGNIVFNVQHDAPARLYYQCTSHSGMVGTIYIVGGPQIISGIVTATSFSGAIELSSDTSPQLGGNLETNNNDIRFATNNVAAFGNNTDFLIYHNGTDSLIRNLNGDLIIGTYGGGGEYPGDDVIIESADDFEVKLNTTVNPGSGTTAIYATGGGSVALNHNGSTKFETTASGIDVTGHTETDTLNVSGVSTFQNNVHLLDGDILQIGGSVGTFDGLEIYHNNLNSVIKDSGTGSLFIQSNNLRLQSPTNETLAEFTQNNSVDLYYDNSKKFETTASGIDVTGHTETDTLNVSGVSTFSDLVDIDGDINIGTGNQGSQITYTSSSNELKFVDSATLSFGDDSDLEIYHDSSNTNIRNQTGHLYIDQRSNDQDIILRSDNGSGGTSVYFRADGSNGEALLYHYGTAKLATQSYGINVIGEVQCDSLDVDGDSDISGNMNVVGVSTLGTVEVSSGIITSTSGVVTYYGDGSKLTGVEAASFLFNTGISSSVSVVATGVGSTILTLPSTAGQKYIIHSILASNIAVGNTEVNFVGAFDFNGGERSYFANQIPIPTGTSVEMLKQPQVLNPNDSIIVRSTDFDRVGANDIINVYVSYEEKTSTDLIGIGIGTVGLASTSTTEIYTSSTYPSVVQSIRLVNKVDTGPKIASVSISNGVTTSFLVDNLIVPKYGSVEVLDNAKSIQINDVVQVQLDEGASIDVQLSAKKIIN